MKKNSGLRPLIGLQKTTRYPENFFGKTPGVQKEVRLVENV